ncbi:MAG: alpha/beta hydrolase family protein [Persicimonas sp.]
MNRRYIGLILMSLAASLWLGCASGAQEREPVAETSDPSISDDQPVPDDQPAEDESSGLEDRLEGSWRGVLEVPGTELPLVFHLAKNDGDEWEATIDSPAQGATGIPVSEVNLDGEKIRLAIPSIGGTYEGAVAEDASQIDGTWSQQGQSYPLNLEPQADGEANSPDRPQMPEPPYPYESEEVEFAGGEPTAGTEGSVTLAGTLTLPDSEGPHPAVVLVSGSGPQDRDETLAGHKPFLVLADHLTRHGVAVLRYDDRGVGESTGTFEGATIADFTADTAAAVDFLAARSEIDADSVGIVGHSEGANVAPRASLQSDTVAFVVLLAPTAVPGAELLARQNALIFEGMGMSPEGAKAYEKRMLESISRLVEAPLDEPVSEELRGQLRADFEAAADAMSPDDRKIYGPNETAAFEKVLDSLVDQLSMAWMRSFLAMKPAETFEQVDAPLLAVFGAKDVQVASEQNAPVLRTLLADHPDATIEVLDGLNHLFQPADTGMPGEYATISTTLAPELLDTVVTWLATHDFASRTPEQ